MGNEQNNGPQELQLKLQYDYRNMFHDAIGVRNRGLNTTEHPFSLVRDRWGHGDRQPQVSLGFFGDHGLIRIDLWIKKGKPTVFVGTEIYSQGLDGNTRGKGQQTFQVARQLIQEIANMVGVSLVHIAVTHSKSSDLPRGASYELIDAEESLTELRGLVPEGLGELMHSPNEADEQPMVWIRKYNPDLQASPSYPFLEEERKKVKWMTQHIPEQVSTPPPITPLD